MKKKGFALANEIIAEVANEYGIFMLDLVGRRKTRTYVAARRDAIHRIKEETDLSVVEIAQMFGRDHSTILNALKER